MNIKLMKALIFFALMFTGTVVNAENKNSFSFKTGSFTLDKTSQSIDSSPFVFEAKSTSVFSVEYERLLRNDFSIGAGFLSYTNEIISGSSINNTLETFHIMAIGKKYLSIGDHFLPYVGVGVGVTTAAIDGVGAGFGFHGIVGIKFKFNGVSAIIETRFDSAIPQDVYNDGVDVSGTGVLVGISFNF